MLYQFWQWIIAIDWSSRSLLPCNANQFCCLLCQTKHPFDFVQPSALILSNVWSDAVRIYRLYQVTLIDRTVHMKYIDWVVFLILSSNRRVDQSITFSFVLLHVRSSFIHSQCRGAYESIYYRCVSKMIWPLRLFWAAMPNMKWIVRL